MIIHQKWKSVLSIMAGLFIVHSSIGQSAPNVKSLEAAEERMFQQIKYPTSSAYLMQEAMPDFFSINADGTAQTLSKAIADSARMKMFAAASYKFFDRQYRVYGNVGIVNGRCQAYMGELYVVEFLYTAVFVNDRGKWKYASWQGTISKDSPPPPPMPKG
jgi:hypothetical protein